MENRMVTGMCVLLMGLMALGCAKKNEGGGASPTPDTPTTTQAPAEKKTHASATGKYVDVKKINEDYINIVETYVEDINQASTGADVANAMNSFADRMEKTWPKMKAIMDKYPELQNKETMPEELKDQEQRAQDVGKQMADAMTKTMKHMMDPQVQQAQQRFMALMQKMQQDAEGAEQP